MSKVLLGRIGYQQPYATRPRPLTTLAHYHTPLATATGFAVLVCSITVSGESLKKRKAEIEDSMLNTESALNTNKGAW
jgi:hypothetical protein